MVVLANSLWHEFNCDLCAGPYNSGFYDRIVQNSLRAKYLQNFWRRESVFAELKYRVIDVLADFILDV